MATVKRHIQNEGIGGMSVRIDAVDRKILASLQRDASQSLDDIAKEVGSSKTPVWNRIRKLREAGVIGQQTVILDAEKLGLEACFFVLVRTSEHEADWQERLLQVLRARPGDPISYTDGAGIVGRGTFVAPLDVGRPPPLTEIPLMYDTHTDTVPGRTSLISPVMPDCGQGEVMRAQMRMLADHLPELLSWSQSPPCRACPEVLRRSLPRRSQSDSFRPYQNR